MQQCSAKNCIFVFHKVRYSHSLGMVSHLNAVVLKYNWGRYLPKIIKIGTPLLKMWGK